MGHQSYVLLCTETTLSNPPSCTAQIQLRRSSIKKSLPKCSLIKISIHCLRVLSVSFPLMQSSSYVWSRESAELRAESRSGSNAGQSSKARSNKKFLQLYFSEAKSKFSTHFKLYYKPTNLATYVLQTFKQTYSSKCTYKWRIL